MEKATGKTLEQLVSATMEQIDIKPLYTQADIKDLKHLGYVAGVPPFLRGPYPAMYVTKPWTVRQYAGFSTADGRTGGARKVFHAVEPASGPAPARSGPCCHDHEPCSLTAHGLPRGFPAATQAQARWP